jgi:hypothetical protein
MRCGKRKTAMSRNFASWTFCSSHNAFWQVKNCHDAKFASWLLEKTIGNDRNAFWQHLIARSRRGRFL